LHRLENEQSLARYAEWFIPLKIVTGSEEWKKWAARYQSEGQGIPIIFVVRADGEKLYARSGSLPGIELYQMIESVLPQSGQIFDDRTLLTIQTALNDAKNELEQGNTAAAVKKINKLSKYGTPGDLGSYAKVAIDAGNFTQKLVERGKSSLADAEQKLTTPSTAIEGALALIEIANTYRPLAPLRNDIRKTRNKFKQMPEIQNVLRQAGTLARARKLMKQPNDLRPALTMLGQIMSEFPDSDAAVLAAQWIKEELVDERDAGDTTKMYPWTSNNSHNIVASLVKGDREQGTGAIKQVTLKKQDGAQIIVPYQRLSTSSQVLASTILDLRETATQ
jgi:hypothetical protein